MKAEVEIYRGIEFVRLSSLRKEQAKLILESAYSRKIIKVLRDGELLSDCLPYRTYTEWYNLSSQNVPEPKDEIQKSFPAFKLALK